MTNEELLGLVQEDDVKRIRYFQKILKDMEEDQSCEYWKDPILAAIHERMRSGIDNTAAEMAAGVLSKLLWAYHKQACEGPTPSK